MIAALFVATGGPYYGLEGVDPWDEARDARAYPGPHPVVAHPPCERWGRYWSGGPSAKVRRTLGDDGGCFASALASVELWGGVLEHPADSRAWDAFGLPVPLRGRGWVRRLDRPGWACHVEQGNYGHRARKATWLYAVGCDMPELKWGAADGCVRLEDGFHSTEERRRARESGVPPVPRLSERERIHTPEPFRDLLIAMARSAEQGRRAA